MGKLLSLILVGALFAIISPASASFGDCTDPDYMRGFEDGSEGVDPTAPSLDINCVIEFEFDYSTPHGNRRIRGIRDINADWAFAEGSLAQVEAGARAAVAAMRLLGDYHVDDITLLILDDTYGRLDHEADADTGALTQSSATGECLVDVYMLSNMGGPEYTPFVIAHEIFHCIQNASLTPGQLNTQMTEGAWWTEGSADYFAALAAPDSVVARGRAQNFENGVDANAPLYDYTYGATIFFFWFHEERGPSQLMPFLHQMADVNTDAAQRDAMRATLSDEDWLHFIEAYADRSIRLPSGGLLLFSNEGNTYAFNATRTERFTLQPFAVNHGWLTYECGAWENELRPRDVNLGARRDSARAWGDLPDEIDTEGAGEVRYRFAAINTGDAPQNVELEVRRIRSCEPCNDSEEIDICLIGEWEMTGGGPIEWMRAQGLPITAADPGQRMISFDERGVYYAKSFATSMEMVLGDERASADGQAMPAAGRWSVSRPEKKLAICQDAGGMQGTVRTPHGEIPVAQAGGGVQVMDYACSKTTLDTSLNVGGGAPMDTTYTRRTPPPPELD
ncbi:hypothetical protein [Hyphococcus sp.]|uniref:hypothetical protein n=1 Tax=Hyphococcus sp. TaxID=2038636 RepID=UPI00208377E2|nr:MAG: hypothetical protein DHS20C04_19090 [Marinicaulis sp.]